MKIHLLGVAHWLQTSGNGASAGLMEKRNRFENYVRDVVQSKMVTAIAEETNVEIEARQGKSIARTIAESRSPPLLYAPCEMNSSERLHAGMPTGEEIIEKCISESSNADLEACRDAELRKYFPIREEYWIRSLRQLAVDSVLFICGASHIGSFSQRLIMNGIQCEVIDEDWGFKDDGEFGELSLEERPI